MTFGNPVTLIVSKFFKTGETLFGVKSVTVVGDEETVTDRELSVFPLTLTVNVGLVVTVVLNLDVKHLIRVEEIDTISHLELSLKVKEIELPSVSD